MTAASDPIRAEELDALFAPLGDPRSGARVALAVSGGSDSTALMVLFADWLRRHAADAQAHTVLTVDHRLRPESAAEAGAVATRAAALGLRHATLVWESPKPQAGLQAAARAARYRLMGDYARADGIAVLLTAHTLDDQAETLLMRLARGSGLDGLASIAPLTRLGALRLLRPLLEVSKSRLVATLERRGIAWIEDPSNQSCAFERTRLRAARAELDGLGLTPDMLGLSARRLQRARAALDCATDRLCLAPPEGAVHTDPVGVFRIDAGRLRGAPAEVALRLLGRAIAGAGGSDEPVPLARLEAIVESVCQAIPLERRSWTLARSVITAAADAIKVEREPGRQPPPRLSLAGGSQALWDGRFAVAVAPDFDRAVGKGAPQSLEVRALGAEGVAELRRLGSAFKSTRSLQLTASFWQGPRLLAVPPLGFWAPRALQAGLSADFVGLRYNSSAAAAAEQRS